MPPISTKAANIVWFSNSSVNARRRQHRPPFLHVTMRIQVKGHLRVQVRDPTTRIQVRDLPCAVRQRHTYIQHIDIKNRNSLYIDFLVLYVFKIRICLRCNSS